ncbi:MAG: hypothetical protein R3232_04895 [Clostridia bacterium]|nr:hypothetical protein [Clostridia bacterium]
MKILKIVIIILILLGLPIVALARPKPEDSPFIANPPDSFTARGYEFINPDYSHPYHELQQTVVWSFKDGKETHVHFEYSIPEGSPGGPTEHIIDIYVTYEKDLVRSESTLFFVNGTYSHQISGTSSIRGTHNGFVKGELLPVLPARRGFKSDYEKANALVLDMTPFGIMWDWKLILEIEGEVYETGSPAGTTQPPVETPTPADTNPPTGTQDEPASTPFPNTDRDYMDGYPSKYYGGCDMLLPGPPKPLQIGLYVAIVAIMVYLLNIVTDTFIYGDVPYNTIFDPKKPYKLARLKRFNKDSQSKGNLFSRLLGSISGSLFKIREMLVNDGRDYAADIKQLEGKDLEAAPEE